MRWRIKSYKKTITEELADAISSFNLTQVDLLLSDSGKFAVQNEKYEIFFSGKQAFIDWMRSCYSKSYSTGRSRRKITYNVVKSMHSYTGSQIILFDEGRFPLLTASQAKEEKSGLIIKFEENKITGIEFCFLVMKTESPFIYERRYLGPVS
jgi:hypothetical protein